MPQNNVLTTAKLSDCNTLSIIIAVPHVRDIVFSSMISGDTSNWVSKSSQQALCISLPLQGEEADLPALCSLHSIFHLMSNQAREPRKMLKTPQCPMESISVLQRGSLKIFPLNIYTHFSTVRNRRHSFFVCCFF